jgi:hypothetical protein
MKTTSKVRNYIFYASLIIFLIASIVAIINGYEYSSIFDGRSFSGTKFELLIYLVSIGGYILSWLGWLGILILAYIWKKLYENPEL